MIITNNEEALRVYCHPVLPEEVGELVSILEKELANSAKLGNPGIGLAAPQIGIAKDIAIIRLGNPEFDVNLVNSKIEQAYDKKIFQSEGCLSFPGRYETTMRYQEICVDNPLGYPKKFIASGLLAVACQHEIDHLNKSLFFDLSVNKKSKAGPNDPCICGKVDPVSGKIKKYKKCCGS